MLWGEVFTIGLTIFLGEDYCALTLGGKFIIEELESVLVKLFRNIGNFMYK